MKIKGIIFDKDGTLFALNGIWIDICQRLIMNIINNFQLPVNLKDKLLKGIGIKDNKIVSNSILASSTVHDLIEKLYEIILKNTTKNINKKDFIEYGLEQIEFLSKEVEDNFITIANLDYILDILKKQGFYLGLITADLKTTVIPFLERRNLVTYFDYIGADDGEIEPKPNPKMLKEFCKECNIKPQEVAVVGDSIKDIEFAKRGNSGLAIGVLSGTSTRKVLNRKCDYIFEDIERLIESDLLFS
ncbi:MAG: HAD family hydrolase [Halanaerobiales bacterium]